MMRFTEFTVEKIQDPFGILSGNRYEFFIHFEVDEEDELFNDNGLKLKVLYIVDSSGPRIAHYHILEDTTEKILDFDLEEDEIQQLQVFCQEHFVEA